MVAGVPLGENLEDLALVWLLLQVAPYLTHIASLRMPSRDPFSLLETVFSWGRSPLTSTMASSKSCLLQIHWQTIHLYKRCVAFLV